MFFLLVILIKKKRKLIFLWKYYLFFEIIKYIWLLIENVLKFNEIYYFVNILFDYVYDIEFGNFFKDDFDNWYFYILLYKFINI